MSFWGGLRRAQEKIGHSFALKKDANFSCTDFLEGCQVHPPPETEGYRVHLFGGAAAQPAFSDLGAVFVLFWFGPGSKTIYGQRT